MREYARAFLKPSKSFHIVTTTSLKECIEGLERMRTVRNWWSNHYTRPMIRIVFSRVDTNTYSYVLNRDYRRDINVQVEGILKTDGVFTEVFGNATSNNISFIALGVVGVAVFLLSLAAGGVSFLHIAIVSIPLFVAFTGALLTMMFLWAAFIQDSLVNRIKYAVGYSDAVHRPIHIREQKSHLNNDRH